MKALSFRQPWAELILQGRKTLDLRTYLTHYRGPLAIYASQTVERQACLKHGLDPDRLVTGGVVGVVQLIDVVPLSESEYTSREGEHLAGRSFKDGMYGWVLRQPQRLLEPVPAQGRMSLFNIDLELPGEPQAAGGGQPERPAPPSARPPGGANHHRPAGRSNYRSFATSDRPFELQVKAIPAADTSAATGYALTLRQQIVRPPEVQQTFYGESPATMASIVTLAGDSLLSVSDHVLEALREAGYKATDLSPNRRASFHLPEPVGVRLGLVFLAVKPVSKPDRIEAISAGIRKMTPEELYYWYSKCTAADTAERAQKALRILLAAE